MYADENACMYVLINNVARQQVEGKYAGGMETLGVDELHIKLGIHMKKGLKGSNIQEHEN